jgi:cytochrome c oxidase assembly factor CtaG
MKRVTAIAAVIAAFAAAPAAAHNGAHHGGAPGWTLDLSITIPLALAALLFAIGFVRLSRRSRRARAGRRKQAWLYAAGWLTLAGSLVSPLHEAGERSFTMHMIEHELLMLVAALLLVAAQPGAILMWGLPRAGRQLVGRLARQSVWGLLTGPVTATTIQSAAIVVWHLPGLFNRARSHESWHIAQHLSFIAGALLFWWSMLYRSTEGVAAMCLFVTSMIGGALGALMALSTSPWYADYAAMGMTPMGLTPAEDQQVAGLIMWVPGGLFHLGAALLILARWFTRRDGGDATDRSHPLARSR